MLEAPVGVARRVLESALRFRRAIPAPKVVILSATEEREIMVAALHAGAAGYIPKTHKPDRIIAALHLVAAGGSYLPGEVASAEPIRLGSTTVTPARAAARGLRLSGRQLAVLHLLIEGCTNRDVALRLGICEGTAKKHTAAVYAALGVTSRTQAMIAAARHGISIG